MKLSNFLESLLSHASLEKIPPTKKLPEKNPISVKTFEDTEETPPGKDHPQGKTYVMKKNVTKCMWGYNREKPGSKVCVKILPKGTEKKTMKLSNFLILAYNLKEVKTKYPDAEKDLDEALSHGMSNKWIVWLARNHKDHKVKDLVKLTNDADVRMNKGTLNKDIEFWNKKSFEDLDKGVDESTLSKSEINKLKKQEGSTLLDTVGDWKVYDITSYEASVLYGKNTKWCISGRNKSHWDSHKESGIDITFVVNKKTDEKYAVTAVGEDRDFVNAKNEYMTEKEFSNAVGSETASKTLSLISSKAAKTNPKGKPDAEKSNKDTSTKETTPEKNEPKGNRYSLEKDITKCMKGYKREKPGSKVCVKILPEGTEKKQS